MMTTTIPTPQSMHEFAASSVRALMPGSRATVLALSGDLGAGKTTFTQGVAKALGVEDAVQSPTFMVMRRYPVSGLFSSLIHVDAYRIEHEDELRVLGFEELLADPHNLIVIEWAERVPRYIPDEAQRMHFAHSEGESRVVTHTLPIQS